MSSIFQAKPKMRLMRDSEKLNNYSLPSGQQQHQQHLLYWEEGVEVREVALLKLAVLQEQEVSVAVPLLTLSVLVSIVGVLPGGIPIRRHRVDHPRFRSHLGKGAEGT